MDAVRVAPRTTPSSTRARAAERSTGQFGSGESRTSRREAGRRLLGAGTYQLVATANASGAGPVSSAPMTLKISAAVLTTNLTVATDPQNSRNAVISTSLSGPFIDEINNGDDTWVVPAGAWHVAITDAGGATAFSKDVTTAAGTTSFLNLYWQNVPPGGSYTASAKFTPSGSAAANFAITPAAGVTYTTPAKPTATPTPGPTDAPAETSLTGAAVPLWLLILLGLIGLAALALLIVAIVRRPRPVGAHSTAEPSSHPEPEGEEPTP